MSAFSTNDFNSNSLYSKKQGSLRSGAASAEEEESLLRDHELSLTPPPTPTGQEGAITTQLAGGHGTMGSQDEVCGCCEWQYCLDGLAVKMNFASLVKLKRGGTSYHRLFEKEETGTHCLHMSWEIYFH